MEKRYNLLTAIAMVVGTVIGSGVFFKAEVVLKNTGGNLLIGVLSWLIMGVVMIICTYTFGLVAGNYEGADGLVAFTRASCGKTYAYYVGWFMTVVYYPTLTGVLCWLPARYLGVLIGGEVWSNPTSAPVMTLSVVFMVLTYAMSALAPKLAGKFQISTTAIKLIPLGLMAVVGTIVGLTNGQITYNFANIVDPSVAPTTGLFAGVVALSFAYEGWICATSIGSELKDAKRNLPRALVIGAIIVVAVYVAYYIGLAGALDSAVMMENGQDGAKLAFQNIFGQVGGALIFVFVVISCWGTCNGLTMSVCRGMYDLAVDSDSDKLKMFKNIDPTTGMPSNSSVVGLLMTGLWLVYFYGANLAPTPWFGPFCFDSSELPIITLYLLYIPIFIKLMSLKNLKGFNRYVVPVLAIICCLFMCFACIYTYRIKVLFYLIVFAVIMLAGALLKGKKSA
ncbi:MAG: APC family permease [Oscillospiraceae bacterium]|nr:APC family permease [Oscillospiraceae bacterium]